MAKTVNEIIKNEFKKIYKYNIVKFDNNVIEDLLHKILYDYKNEIVKKDEYIKSLINGIENNTCKNYPIKNKELEQIQLIVDLIETYKYEIIKYQNSQYSDKTIEIEMLKFFIKDLKKYLLFKMTNYLMRMWNNDL